MNNEIYKSLSGGDILNALDQKCNLVLYSQIHNFNSIEELLGKYKKCVILYHTSENYGHWTALYENKGTIYFFDSYGIIPDNELKFLHKEKPNIATCGRWCINRLQNTDISVDNYYKIFKEASKKIDIDKLICLLVPIK